MRKKAGGDGNVRDLRAKRLLLLLAGSVLVIAGVATLVVVRVQGGVPIGKFLMDCDNAYAEYCRHYAVAAKRWLTAAGVAVASVMLGATFFAWAWWKRDAASSEANGEAVPSGYW